MNFQIFALSDRSRIVVKHTLFVYSVSRLAIHGANEHLKINYIYGIVVATFALQTGCKLA